MIAAPYIHDSNNVTVSNSFIITASLQLACVCIVNICDGKLHGAISTTHTSDHGMDGNNCVTTKKRQSRVVCATKQIKCTIHTYTMAGLNATTNFTCTFIKKQINSPALFQCAINCVAASEPVNTYTQFTSVCVRFLYFCYSSKIYPSPYFY